MIHVAVLGLGDMGKRLARLLLDDGHQVALGHPDPAKAGSVASVLGGKATGHDLETAASVAEIIFLASLFGAVGPLWGQLAT